MQACALSANELRIDKWLFFARHFKTRGLAAKACTGGKVQLNGERCKPARTTRAGDVIDITKAPYRYRYTVLTIPDRRGPASEAQSCYEEDVALRAAREARQSAMRADRAQTPRTHGRPDKHTRKKLRDRKLGDS